MKCEIVVCHDGDMASHMTTSNGITNLGGVISVLPVGICGSRVTYPPRKQVECKLLILLP